MTTPEPDPSAPASARPAPDTGSETDKPPARRATPAATRLLGPWRIAVAEASMLPSIQPGDWLLVDPSTNRWPRRGSIVVFREPETETETLSIKRVAGRAGDRVPFEGGYLHLGPDEAWLLSDADESTTAAAGYGAPLDSRRYGPVPLTLLVGRAWFRYGPLERIGLLPGRPRTTGRLRAIGRPRVPGRPRAIGRPHGTGRPRVPGRPRGSGHPVQLVSGRRIADQQPAGSPGSRAGAGQ